MEHLELRWGIPNRVGSATVFVMAVRPSAVRLAVSDDRGERLSRTYAVGDSVEINQASWRVVETLPVSRNESAAPAPGDGAGTVVAVLARA